MNILHLQCQIDIYWNCQVTGQAELCGEVREHRNLSVTNNQQADLKWWEWIHRRFHTKHIVHFSISRDTIK